MKFFVDYLRQNKAQAACGTHMHTFTADLVWDPLTELFSVKMER